MQRLRLSSLGTTQGEISWVTTERGTEFAHLRAGPQTIAGRTRHQPPGIWLGVVAEGEACLDYQGQRTRLGCGSILFGPTGAQAALQFATGFRLLLVTVPDRLLYARMIEPVTVGVTMPGARRGMDTVLLDFLLSASRAMDDLSMRDLRFLEAAYTELLIGALQSGEWAGQPGQANPPSLRRLQQAIEAMLDNPDLTIGSLSEEIGLSARYIQKLLSGTNETFTQYVKRRRLARCHADLANPGMAHLSISGICFAHGFNDAAHFSHAFRKHYGMAARDVRRMHAPAPG